MKKIVFALLFISLLFSCNKYPDGPGMSLRPKKWRLSGSWHIEQLLVNGQDMTSAYYPNHDYYESYEVNGQFGFNTGSYISSDSCTWRWIEHKTKIFRSPSSNSYNGTVTVLRLENKSFWYSYTAGGQTYELHMKQD